MRDSSPRSPVFLPGEFLGQSSLVGYSPWDRRVWHDWAINTFFGMHCLTYYLPKVKLMHTSQVEYLYLHQLLQILGWKMIFHCYFNFHFLITNQIEYLFMCFFLAVCFFFWNCAVHESLLTFGEEESTSLFLNWYIRILQKIEILTSYCSVCYIFSSPNIFYCCLYL